MKNVKLSPFLVSVAAVILVTALTCIFAISCAGGTMNFEAEYYFVCYRTEDNAISASSISGAVTNYGGAGYILGYGGAYYVTVSCYYSEKDAQAVCETLKKRDLNCTVLKVKTGNYRLPHEAKNREKLYLGNLNTLHSLSTLAYECANALDTGGYNQTKAKSVLGDIKNGLNGLKIANEQNCFSGEIERLIAVCDDTGGGYIYSKDMRKLQIAIADCIINIELY